MNPQEDSRMMPADAKTLTAKFRSEYGRLCVLTAEATHRGLPRHWVTTASRGEGSNNQQPYVELRWQRRRVNSILAMCKSAGIDARTLIDAARSSRIAVEEEFMFRIPLR